MNPNDNNKPSTSATLTPTKKEKTEKKQKLKQEIIIKEFSNGFQYYWDNLTLQEQENIKEIRSYCSQNYWDNIASKHRDKILKKISETSKLILNRLKTEKIRKI